MLERIYKLLVDWTFKQRAVAFLVTIAAGLDQLRRAYRKPRVERPLRLFT